jgi:hypothetical protein
VRFSYATISLPTLSLEEAAHAAAAAGYAGLECKLGEDPHAAGSSAESFLLGNRTTLGLDPYEGRRAARACAAAGIELVGLSPYIATGDLEHTSDGLSRWPPQRVPRSCGFRGRGRPRGALAITSCSPWRWSSSDTLLPLPNRPESGS